MPTLTPNPIGTDYAKQFEAACAKWTDERFLSREELYGLGMFTQYIVNLADAGGWLYCGHSFKVSAGMSTLTVKSMLGEDPMVCFTSGRTFSNCVKIFVRKMLGDMVEWRPDQYR